MTLKVCLLTGLVPLLASSAGAAVLVNDNFNNNDFGTVSGADIGGGVIYNNGSKSAAETTVGRWSPGTTADGWQRTEYHSNNEIPVSTFLSSPGASVIFSWTVGNISTLRRDTTTSPEYRIQLGILPSTVAQGGGAEMYVNTQGGIWLDMNILGTNTSGADVQLHESNLGKTVNMDAPQVTTLADPSGWNWGNSSRTFSLTLTATGYAWSDSAGTNYGGNTYAAAGFTAPFLGDSFWGFHMGQDRDVIGRGGHDLTNFSVVAVPEAGSMMLLGLTAAGAVTRRRRA